MRYDPPGLYGTATELVIRDVHQLKEGASPTVFLLANPGSSEVLLEVDQAVDNALGWDLRITGQNSSRSSLPFQGIARIDLFLDGLWIETKSLSHVEIRTDAFQVPSTWLSTGRHRLRLSLNSSSTTSYRLFSASLHPRTSPEK